MCPPSLTLVFFVNGVDNGLCFTKKDVCEPVGIQYLQYVSANIKIPYVAIGGIKEHNIQEVAKNGGKAIALVTEIVGADNIRKKIKTIRNKINEVRN